MVHRPFVGLDRSLFFGFYASGSVVHLSPDGQLLGQFGQPDERTVRLNMPGGIAVDASGQVFVTDIGSGRLALFNADGSVLRTWDLPRLGREPAFWPGSLAIDACGTLYVALGAYVQRRDSSGELINRELLPGISPSRIRSDSACARSRKREIC